MGFEDIEYEQSCGCKTIYTEHDSFNYVSDVKYVRCYKHQQEMNEFIKREEERRKEEDDLRQREGILCECGVKYHQTLDKYHHTDSRHTKYLHNRHADEIRAINTNTYIPIKLAILKYKEQMGISSSNHWIRRRLCYLKVIDIKKEKGRYYCSKERLDKIDFKILH